MSEIEVTKRDIQRIKKEFREHHTIEGTKKPVILDDFSARLIALNRKGFRMWKSSIHKSHRMNKWHTEVRAPAGTPRYYNCRQCTKCGGEQKYHAAGRFIDSPLLRECRKCEE
jgi:hypothetical protein